MSEQANATPATETVPAAATTAPQSAAPVTAASASEPTPADELCSKYAKRGKISVDYNASEDEKNAFVTAVTRIQDEDKESFVDWTTKVPEGFDTLALIKREFDGSNILIAIANRDLMFADSAVSAYLYRLAKNKIMGAADNEDSTEASFITVAGCFKQRFDKEAYTFQARSFVKALHQRGLSGVTIGNLRNAFASAPFAASQFPRVPSEQWKALIQLAASKAEGKGYDTSIFDYWLATRELVVDDGETIDLGDLAKFGEDVDEAATVATTDAENTAPAPATTSAETVAATA